MGPKPKIKCFPILLDIVAYRDIRHTLLGKNSNLAKAIHCECTCPFKVWIPRGIPGKLKDVGEEGSAHLVGPVCCTLFGVNKYWIVLFATLAPTPNHPALSGPLSTPSHPTPLECLHSCRRICWPDFLCRLCHC